MSSEVILKMEGISKAFPGVQALQDVDFELRQAEVHVLLGENGAGKSTLMKILSGAYSKDAGHIRLDGQIVDIDCPRRALELGIVEIYQEFNLVPNLSVAENVFLSTLPGPSGLVDWRTLYTRTEELLRRLGMDLDPRAPVETLSVAQRQMVEIAGALSQTAKVVIMDEPTAPLNSREIRRLFEIIHTLKEAGISIIYISHRLEELAEIGDRVTVLRDGGVVGVVDARSTSLSTLIRMMVGRELKQKFPKETIPLGPEALRVEGLSRAGKLHDVSFTLRKGEVLGIFGLLGAGMTDLAESVFGAAPADTGQIYVNGKAVRIRDPRDAIENGLGYLPKDKKGKGLIETMSVLENVSLAALDRVFPDSYLLSPAHERRFVSPYVDELRIKTPSLSQWVKLLSGGNQQKVIIAKWLCCEAEVLIFDAPTRGIDVGAKVEVYRLMNDLARDGAGIIMISDEIPEILGMSDRVLVMSRGRVVGQLTPEEATQEKLLRLAMRGQAQ